MTASGGMGPLRAALSLCCLLARLYVLAIARISAALPELPLRRCMAASMLSRTIGFSSAIKVIERSLVKWVFAEESEYPPRTDFLAAREGDVLSRQIACLGDCGAEPADELAFRLDR